MSLFTYIRSSKRFAVNLRDTGKAFIVAIITAVLTFILKSLDTGQLTWDYKGIIIAAVSGAIAFVSLTFFSPAPK